MAKKKYIETPERLLKMWDEYKLSVDESKDEIQKATNLGVQSEKVDKPYLRQGFEAFVYRKYGFLVKQYLDNQDGLYDEYMGVITCIRTEWEENQVSGTLTGKFKAPNLTARMNGYTDKKEMEIKGTLNVPQIPNISKRE
jgi:hypothetical protein